eukprot:TRINITY_DN62660_c0_g1_i1.p1 TRINITY_DN62660_c0_g1~~TRINITY_DN62660_c0_g1_i1.p1  ORF type:complete len:692 (-),score=11.73 TRINITY_DN62660_c0_g1_i1:185-2131(-)
MTCLLGCLRSRREAQKEDRKPFVLVKLSEKGSVWTDSNSSNSDEIITLNVGGTIFKTTKRALLTENNSFFSAMLSGEWQPDGDSGEYLIDRSPRLFCAILDYLRDGKVFRYLHRLSADEKWLLLTELDFYSIPVPPHLLQSQELNISTTVPYLRLVQQLLDEEAKSSLMATLGDTLVVQRTAQIMETVEHLLDIWTVSDLRLVYEVFVRLNHKQPLVQAVKLACEKHCLRVVEMEKAEQTQDPHSTPTLEPLFDLHVQYMGLVDECLYTTSTTGTVKADVDFQNAIQQAFRASCSTLTTFEECLANLTRAPHAKVVPVVTTLSPYCQNQDLYIAFVMNITQGVCMQTHPDLEGWMTLLEELRCTFGEAQFTALKTRVLDRQQSDVWNVEWRAAHEEHKWLSVVTVPANWQGLRLTPIPLPQSLSEPLDAYNKWFRSKYRDRVLKWCHHYGEATVMFNHKNSAGGTELLINPKLMFVLLLFNEKGEWTFSELVERTHISRGHLLDILAALCPASAPAVLKRVSGPDCPDPEKSTFVVNENFESKQLRLRLHIIKRQTQTEEEAQLKRKQEQHVIEAAAWKVVYRAGDEGICDRAELMTEMIREMDRRRCMLQSKWEVDPVAVKKVIDSLIDRGYIKRDKNDRSRLIRMV